MAETLEVVVPLSRLDREICSLVSRISVAVERRVKVEPEELAEAARSLWQEMERDRQHRAEQLLGPRPEAGGDPFALFHNRLRILLSIDRHDAVAAGALAEDDLPGWKLLHDRPFSFFIAASDDQARALWTIICEREARGT